MLFYFICGAYDFSRNRPFSWRLLNNYCFSRGTFLWFMSPLNILLDILTIPYKNKKIYQIEDFPKDYQKEINELIKIASTTNIQEKVKGKIGKTKRSMFFHKWYLRNIESDYQIDAFHKDFKYISTIGISVFNERVSTRSHFGPVRASLRMLYNVNDIIGNDAYITSQGVTNYWSENKLFIFDDTLEHRSVNDTDKVRYCLFVDIIRPSYLPGVMRGIVKLINFFMNSANSVFYLRWKKAK